jgi:two-component system response regulator
MKILRNDILIIEDTVGDSELMIRSLMKNHVANQIILTEDGEQALNYIFCRKQYSDRDPLELPGAIFLDLKLPKIDGLEVLRQLKSNEKTKRIPVVVMTSSKESPDIKTAYKLGANSYVVKPVEFYEFQKTITKLC